MSWVRRHTWLTLFATLVLLLLVIVGGYGISLASDAGRLPWQEQPTRIAITPFADIPGFSAPTPTPMS
jgi:hypothetical protein